MIQNNNPGPAGGQRPGLSRNRKTVAHHSNVIPFPREARPKYPPYGSRVAALRRQSADTLLTVLTGSAAMDEAARRFALDAKYGDPPSLFVSMPFERPPGAYDWTFAVGMDVAICTEGKPETDITMLTLARLLLEAGAAHVVVNLSQRIEILRRDERGQIWRAH
ncbi:hypothetical protein [Methylocaldum sp. 14B]|jgi:hypothetical protein|uniref:hypothetical protein n=1 Tax=Methylocaldum sp. 14B TaxID=1912213 RepID=UPI00098A1689|nr:hypothetical protein [Methylocaldum sp. 14B]